MQGTARFVFPILMGGVITFFLTAIVTFINVGVPTDFMSRWIKSWLVAWPIAAIIAIFSISYIRRATDWIVAILDRVA